MPILLIDIIKFSFLIQLSSLAEKASHKRDTLKSALRVLTQKRNYEHRKTEM